MEVLLRAQRNIKLDAEAEIFSFALYLTRSLGKSSIYVLDKHAIHGIEINIRVFC